MPGVRAVTVALSALALGLLGACAAPVVGPADVALAQAHGLLVGVEGRTRPTLHLADRDGAERAWTVTSVRLVGAGGAAHELPVVDRGGGMLPVEIRLDLRPWPALRENPATRLVLRGRGPDGRAAEVEVGLPEAER